MIDLTDFERVEYETEHFTAINSQSGEAFPIGAIFISVDSTNPATSLGYGTWVAFAQGRCLIGVGTSDQTFTAGATGGKSTHKLTISEMPAHTHTAKYSSSGNGANTYVIGSAQNNSSASKTVTTDSTGGSSAHNNLQPYVVVYMWKRTA